MNIIYVLLAFLGVGLASVGIGLAVRYRSKTKLTYLHETCFPLVTPGLLNFPNIDISYRKKPIDSPLYLFTGHFLNSGNTDIPKSSIHSPVLMQLPETYERLAPVILKSLGRVQARCTTIDKSGLTFHWDLLKKNEFFRFAALVKAPPRSQTGKNSGTSENPAKVVSFSHRITSLDRIDREEFVLFEGAKRKWPRFIEPLALLIFVISFVVFFTVSPPREIRYLIEDQNGERPTVSIEATRHNNLLVKGLDGELSLQVEPEELFTKYEFLNALVGVDWSTFYLFVGFLSVPIFLLGILIIKEYSNWRKQRVFRKTLRSEGSQEWKNLIR